MPTSEAVTLLLWQTVITIRRHVAPAAAALSLVLAACSGDEDAVPETTVIATTTTIEPPAVSDGQLAIGILLPTTDTLIGEPTVAGAQTAIERINEAGGVLGGPVRTVVADEGSTSSSASEAIQSLLSRGVDAIIGPASSLIALSTLDEGRFGEDLDYGLGDREITLADYPDNGLFFRTIPSDSLQSQAIADIAAQTGTQRVAIVYADDAYGQSLAKSVTEALEDQPITVVDAIPFSTRDEELSGVALRTIQSDATVTVVLADGNDGTRILEALGQSDTTGIDAVILNDAIRSPNSAQRIEALDPEFRSKVFGVAPQAESSVEGEPFDPPGVFAANGFDCVNLIALSAAKADSDAPADIAAQMTNVSTGGSACREFVTCIQSLEAGLQIDYDGPSGVTELQAGNGDPGRAIFDLFVFDETGRDQLVGPFPVSY